jgi:uncharacterized protein (DUF4415 family)
MPSAKNKIPIEAEIQAQIKADPDDFEPSDAELAHATSFALAFPDLAAGVKRRGRPPLEASKQLVTLHLDQDVIAKFKNTGRGWQQKINDALRRARVK